MAAKHGEVKCCQIRVSEFFSCDKKLIVCINPNFKAIFSAPVNVRKKDLFMNLAGK